jgi:hypothetical protein
VLTIDADVFCADVCQVGLMRERFQHAFNKDANGLPRVWAPSTDIPKFTKQVRYYYYYYYYYK